MCGSVSKNYGTYFSAWCYAEQSNLALYSFQHVGLDSNERSVTDRLAMGGKENISHGYRIGDGCHGDLSITIRHSSSSHVESRTLHGSSPPSKRTETPTPSGR